MTAALPARLLLLGLLCSCESELPFVETQVCDEIRASLSGQVLTCTEDMAAAVALSDELDARIPCAVTGYDATGADLQPGLTTESGVIVELSEAYDCAAVAAELPCGETDALALWAQLTATAPACGPLRDATDDSALSACTPLGTGEVLCETPRAWTEAAAACKAAGMVLWSSDPFYMPDPAWELGEAWLGLSMQTCPDPTACEQMWTWETGGYLSGLALWGTGEPTPITLGTAVYVTLDRPGGNAVTWFAVDPSEQHPFVCQPR